MDHFCSTCHDPVPDDWQDGDECLLCGQRIQPHMCVTDQQEFCTPDYCHAWDPVDGCTNDQEEE